MIMLTIQTTGNILAISGGVIAMIGSVVFMTAFCNGWNLPHPDKAPDSHIYVVDITG